MPGVCMYVCMKGMHVVNVIYGMHVCMYSYVYVCICICMHVCMYERDKCMDEVNLCLG